MGEKATTQRNGGSVKGDRASRRGFLLGLGAAGTAGALRSARAESLPDQRSGCEDDGTQDRLPFFGARQSGVTTPQPAAVLYASFDALASSREDLARLFHVLTERIAFLAQGGMAPEANPLMPPPDSGVLGPRVFPDNLSVVSEI